MCLPVLEACGGVCPCSFVIDPGMGERTEGHGTNPEERVREGIGRATSKTDRTG